MSRLPPCEHEIDPFDGKDLDSLIFDCETRTWMTRRKYYGYDKSPSEFFDPSFKTITDFRSIRRDGALSGSFGGGNRIRWDIPNNDIWNSPHLEVTNIKYETKTPWLSNINVEEKCETCSWGKWKVDCPSCGKPPKK